MVIVNRLTATQRGLPKMAVYTTLPDRQTPTAERVTETKHTVRDHSALAAGVRWTPYLPWTVWFANSSGSRLND